MANMWATNYLPRTLHEFYTLKVPKIYILQAIKTKSYHSLYLPSTWKDKKITSKKIIRKKKNTELRELQAAISFLHNVTQRALHQKARLPSQVRNACR